MMNNLTANGDLVSRTWNADTDNCCRALCYVAGA